MAAGSTTEIDVADRQRRRPRAERRQPADRGVGERAVGPENHYRLAAPLVPGDAIDTRERLRITLHALISNPLIIGCLAGMAYSRFIGAFPIFLDNTFRLTAMVALPMALLSIGGALTLKSLKGNLLLVHGTGDDNCHYQGTEILINELIRHNKPFTMMAYPNRSHGIFEGRGTTRHVYGLLTRYLEENVPAGPRDQGQPVSDRSARVEYK